MSLSKKLGYKGFVDMIYKLEYQMTSEPAVKKNKNPMDDRNVQENDFFANCILSFEFLIGKYLLALDQTEN